MNSSATPGGTPGLESFGQDTASLERLIVGRDTALCDIDIHDSHLQIADKVRGARILVVGGAGSIGAATIRLLVGFRPCALHVVDVNENGLAELVRDLRSRSSIVPDDFRTFPIDYGSLVTERLLTESPTYDLVFNFAAIKHVRSEKDVFSLLQMIDTNLVKHLRFKQWLERYAHARRYFAVSTDKAANPTSLMGATKRLMEDVAFSEEANTDRCVTSARFANVAFSDGSLLQSFIIRLHKRQPLAVPAATQRYFITLAEAAQICVLAMCCAPAHHIVFPRLDAARHLRLLEEIAAEIIRKAGYEPAFYRDADEARVSVQRDMARRRYPLLVTPLDTDGEKSYEEFVGDGEYAVDIGLKMLAGLHHSPSPHWQELVSWFADTIARSSPPIDKGQLVERIQDVLGQFRHRQTGKNLDQRL